MRYPHAIWVPGPQHKQGYGDLRHRIGRGVILHSMEGRIKAALARLNGLDKVSWAFSNPFEGPLLQHYEIEAVTWHAGDAEANRLYLGVENEGVAGEPLNKNQMDNLVGLLHWLAEEEDWPGFTHEVGGTLLEHRWFVATACPSGRIPWQALIARLESTMPEKTLTREQYINICEAEDKQAEETRKKVRQYVFALNGWACPVAPSPPKP